ncbi:MAG: hydroxyacid dehydrogenase [Rhodospirillales bacterium]|nr:hydroxyacid dehydrogenase [Rhodospirillales bacterium]
MANQRKVMLVQGMPAAGRSLLEARDDVLVEECSNDELDTLLERMRDVAAVTLRTTICDRKFIEAAPKLEAVARFGVGYDSVDVEALTERGIPLLIAGEANSRSVAEHAVFMMMALAKRSLQYHGAVQGRRFQDRFGTERDNTELFRKRLLVIGFGRIGTRTTSIGKGLGMAVDVFDPYVEDAAVERAGARRVARLAEALPTADFVTVHCPRNAETEGLIGAAELGLMKPTAILVNTARGGIIDEEALVEALRGGGIRAAGLDVFDLEPPPDDHPLLDLENVLFSPHVAGVTNESMRAMAEVTCQNVLDAFDGRIKPAHIVNPEVLE